jgi:hypothetical protein
MPAIVCLPRLVAERQGEHGADGLAEAPRGFERAGAERAVIATPAATSGCASWSRMARDQARRTSRSALTRREIIGPTA